MLFLLLVVVFFVGLVKGGIWLWSQAVTTSPAVAEPVQATPPAPEPVAAAPVKPLYAKPQVATSRLQSMASPMAFI